MSTNSVNTNSPTKHNKEQKKNLVILPKYKLHIMQ